MIPLGAIAARQLHEAHRDFQVNWQARPPRIEISNAHLISTRGENPPRRSAFIISSWNKKIAALSSEEFHITFSEAFGLQNFTAPQYI